jgi:hypothetical protein
MKYWKKYKSFYGHEPVPIKGWFIEHEDGRYTHINVFGVFNYHGTSIEISKNSPIKDPKTEILKEVPKKEVLRGLKLALETLDLPQEINILKHKL